ncbi:MAG: hypothetical protein E7574_03005 [Ruminococcaceae bacterium]|nr:hypothetical protein [Oscillospiraceae bacterium]
MYIENIKIGNFGKLSHCEYDLKSGINIIEGRNESGKTTLSEFIKFVFYGLSNKSIDGEMSERKKHISWKTNEVSGSIIINTEKGRFRIERAMAPYGAGFKDNITVVDLASNSVVSGIKNPGEYFFGIPEDVFTHTVYIRQAEGAYFNGESIGQAVENIFYSADESVNTTKALKKLDEARVHIKHKKNTGRGLLDLYEKERDELSVALSEARAVNEQIIQNESSLRNTLSSIEKNKKECEKMSDLMRKAELYEVLCGFEEKKKYQEKIDGFKKGKDEIINATTVNGFFPNQEYVKEIDEIKGELNYIDKEVKSFDEDVQPEEILDYPKELAEKIKNYGGKSGVSEKLSALNSKAKTFVVSAMVFGVVGLIAGVLGWLLGKFVANIVTIFAVGSILSFVVCVFCLLMNVKSNSEKKRIYTDFSAGNRQELFAIIDSIQEKEHYFIRKNEMQEYKASKKAEAEQRLYNAIVKALGVLGKWGVVPDTKDYAGVVDCLEAVKTDVNEINNNLALYDREIEKNEAVMNAVTGKLSGFDEENIRIQYDSIEGNVEKENISEIKKKYDFAVMAKDSLAARLTELEKSLAELRAKTDKPADIESRLKIAVGKIEELKMKYDAYMLAYEKLQSAADSLRGRLAPGLASSAGKMMSGLTDGKYKDIGVSDKLELTYSFEDDGATYTKDIAYVSSGTQDIAYVSLRLALAELFSKSGHNMPIIFDEAFARLDDERLLNMLKIAEKYTENSAQAIILTSQKREAVIMKKVSNEDKFNYICI